MPGAAAVRAAHNKAKQAREKTEARHEAVASEASREYSNAITPSTFADVAAGVLSSASSQERSTWKEAAHKAVIMERAGSLESDGANADAGAPADMPAVMRDTSRTASAQGASSADTAATKPPARSGERQGVAAVGFFRFKTQIFDFYNHKYVQGFIAALIIANFLSNVVEKEIDPAGNQFVAVFTTLEDFFNLIFLVELILNAYAHWFWPFLCSAWNVRGPCRPCPPLQHYSSTRGVHAIHRRAARPRPLHVQSRPSPPPANTHGWPLSTPPRRQLLPCASLTCPTPSALVPSP